MTRKRQGGALGDADPADRPGVADAPTESDRLRIRLARSLARAVYAETEGTREARLSAAFRIEIGATVRSASPVLIALFATQGLTLDQAVALIRPARFWPRRPTPSNQTCRYTIRNPLWRYYTTTAPARHQTLLPRHAHTFHGADGNYVRIQVVDHSLEVEAGIAPVWLETRFGELRVQFDEALPETIATASIGRTIEEIVDHDAWRGRGWRIVAVEEPVAKYFGQTLIVAMGSVPHRITWPDTAGTDGRIANQPAGTGSGTRSAGWRD